MKKFLIFDGSPKFKLRKRYYVIAGIVASEAKFNSVLVNLKSKNFKINKGNRSREFKKVLGILFSETLSNDFEIYISLFDSKRFKLTKPEIQTYNFGGNLSHCKFEKGEKGIIGRFWAQSEWLAVENLKEKGIIPILCMDTEEGWLTDICKSHFDNQTKSITDASFYIKNNPNLPLANKKKYFQLVDYVAYYFYEAIKNKTVPRVPVSPYFKIHLMFAYPLNLQTIQLSFSKVL